MKRIVLHIDRLVLHGIDRDDALAVSAGVQAELRRLLAHPMIGQLLVDGGNRSHVQATAPAPVLASGGRHLGQAVAGAVARGIAGKGQAELPS